MVIIIKVDIIGGGISGLSTAISIKENNKNIDVFVHEKNKKIGYNREGRKCGEAHSVEKEWSKWVPEKKSYFNIITKGEIIVGEKKHVYSREADKGYMLNRQEFICQLERKAIKLGVKISTNDKIKNISKLDGDIIVDASGCPSFVKKELGLKKGLVGIGYQQTIENSNCFIPNKLKIIYFGNIGYYWIFPRNPKTKEINVGVGVIDNCHFDLKGMLEKFKKTYNIKGKVNYTTGGFMPIGLQRPLRYKNILFVGDTGVGTFPVTGQGIYRALLSGDIAGKCIAKNKINKYPHIINHEFIKWDVIGKSYNWAYFILRKINPKLVLTLFNFFLDFNKKSLH